MEPARLSDERRRAETERVRRYYDGVSASRSLSSEDGYVLRGATDWIRERARGDTLEIGIGRGRTLRAYSEEVRLTGIELSPVLLALARRRAAELGIQATLLQGDAQELPFAADSFDTVVFSLVLCTIPDAGRAISEALRVLRPGGRLVWVEHVRSPHRALAAVQRFISRRSVPHSGDHYDREPLELLAGTPVVLDETRRRVLGIVEYVAAHKPA